MANPWDPTDPAMATIMGALAQAEQHQGLEQPMMGAPGLQQNPFGVGYQPWAPQPQADIYMHNQGLQGFRPPSLMDTLGVPIDSPWSHLFQALGDTSPALENRRLDQLMTLAGAAEYQNQPGGWLYPLQGMSRALGGVSQGISDIQDGAKLPEIIAQQMEEGSPEFGQSLVENWGLPEWVGMLGEFAVDPTPFGLPADLMRAATMAGPAAVAFLGVPFGAYAARRGDDVARLVANAGGDAADAAARTARAFEDVARRPVTSADDLADSLDTFFRDIPGNTPLGVISHGDGAASLSVMTPNTKLDVTINSARPLSGGDARPVAHIDTVRTTDRFVEPGLGSEGLRDLLFALDSQGVPSNLSAMPFGSGVARYGADAVDDRGLQLLRNVQMYEAMGYQVPVSRIPGTSPDVAPPTTVELVAFGIQQSGLPLPAGIDPIQAGRLAELSQNFVMPLSYGGRQTGYNLPMWRSPVNALDGEQRAVELFARRGQPYMYEHTGYGRPGENPGALLDGSPENDLLRTLMPDADDAARLRYQMWLEEWNQRPGSHIPRGDDPSKAVRSQSDLEAMARFELGAEPNPLGDLQAGIRPASMVESQQNWMDSWRRAIAGDDVPPIAKVEATSDALNRVRENMDMFPNDDFGNVLDELRGAIRGLRDGADWDRQITSAIRDAERHLDQLDARFASQVDAMFDSLRHSSVDSADELALRMNSWRGIVNDSDVSPYTRRATTENMLRHLDESGGGQGLADEILDYIRTPKPGDTVDDVLWGWRLLRDRDADMSNVEALSLAEEAFSNIWSRRANFSDADLTRAADDLLPTLESLAQYSRTDEDLARALLATQQRLAEVDPQLGTRLAEVIRMGGSAP